MAALWFSPEVDLAFRNSQKDEVVKSQFQNANFRQTLLETLQIPRGIRGIAQYSRFGKCNDQMSFAYLTLLDGS